MSYNRDWNEYKKFVIPNKRSKLFEKQIENPNIISNNSKPRLVSNKVMAIQNYLSSSGNSKHNVSIISKKTKKKFKSEASIDLHYINTDLNNVLETFCSKCILYGLHYVTIITGKGKGILKHAVILWLQNNSHFIIEYFEIKDVKNECGSLGVHLRSLTKINNKIK